MCRIFFWNFDSRKIALYEGQMSDVAVVGGLLIIQIVSFASGWPFLGRGPSLKYRTGIAIFLN